MDKARFFSSIILGFGLQYFHFPLLFESYNE